MRKLRALWALLLIGLCLSGCGRQPEPEGERPVIVATLFPAYDFARQIAGERAEVKLLVPPGSESHSYEPTPRDMALVEGCTLLVYNGGESEAWMQRLLEGREHVPALAMLDCVEALEEETVEGMQELREETAEEGPEYDEHVWTSPVNALLICRALCERICALDPEGESLYRANLSAYGEKLEALDAAFRQAVENGKRDTVIFADRFPVRYFTEEYGLRYFAAFPGCADDAEPSARTVAFLIDKVRQEQIPAVFTIEFSDGRMARVLSEDTGCKRLEFHSCHNVTPEQLAAGTGYLELMEKNLENLREALS